MTIKEFAKLCGCNSQTLRYYDRIDLLKPVEVDQWSGYRFYEEAQALDFVKIKNLAPCAAAGHRVYIYFIVVGFFGKKRLILVCSGMYFAVIQACFNECSCQERCSCQECNTKNDSDLLLIFRIHLFAPLPK